VAVAFLSILALALAILATALTGLRRERQLRLWECALTPASRREFEAETRGVQRQLDTIDDTYTLARVRRRRGEADEALRLLDLACRTVEAFVPGRRAQLIEMARISRAVSAMLPVRPLAASAFATPRAAGLVTLSQPLRLMLVTAGERFRLRAFVLARAFGWVAHRTRVHTDRARRADHAWSPLDALRADLATLSGESLECYRVLLASLEREDSVTFVEDFAR
jgi:hypothetical protein